MKKILALTDFSKRAEHAAELALRIAEKTNSELLVYNAFYVPEVIPELTGAYPYYQDLSIIEKENVQKMEKFVQQLTERVSKNRGATTKTKIHHISEPEPIGGKFKNLNTKSQVSMIVMGDKSARDSAFDRFFFGSDTRKVIEKATCPVLLVPEKAKTTHIKTIVLATNLERSDHKALAILAEFARCFDAKIIVIHVSPDKLTIDEKLKNLGSFKEMKAGINYDGISYEDIIGEDVGSTLGNFERRDKPDILAVIHKKHTLLKSIFHHSIIKEMLDYHKVPLMVLP